MDTATFIGLIIAFIAVIGGFGIAIWAITLKHSGRKEERLADIEARNKERMALIEKGMDPNLADRKHHTPISGIPLLFGLIIIFAVIGRVIAFISFAGSSPDDKTFIYALPAFFAGFGFLIYHLYQKKISGKNK